jgi:hypothetical protein
MYENELKEANEYNSVLFAQLQELEAKCAEENRLKEGKFLPPFCPVNPKFLPLFCLVNPIISGYTLDWSWFCLVEYKDQLMALGVIPGALGSGAKAYADLKADLDEEKATQVAAQIEADVLSRAVRNLKISADRLLAILKPNRIIHMRMDANCSRFQLRVFLGLSNPQG